MSRIMPDENEISFLKHWAKQKIAAYLDQDKFADIAEFSKLYSFFQLGLEEVAKVGGNWNFDRILDIYDIASELQQIPATSTRAERLESDILKLMTLIAEYEQINGSTKIGDGVDYVGKVWRIPEGWGKST